MDMNSLGPGLLDQFGNDFGTCRIEETLPDLHSIHDLAEGVCHAAANDDIIGLVEEIADERDFVSNLGTAENGKQRTLRVLDDGSKGAEFLFNQKSCDLVGKIHPGDAGVCAVGGAESIVDINITQFAQAGPEGGHICRIGFDAVSLGILGLALFLDMKTDILKQHDLARLQGGTGCLDFGADAVLEKLHRFAKKFLKFFGNGFECVLGSILAVGPSQMTGQNNRCPVVEGILDGGECGSDALRVGDFTGLLVLRDIEIDADEDAFTGKFEILDGFFSHEIERLEFE